MSIKRSVWLLAVLACVALIGTGCVSSGTASTDPAALEGSWVLESFGGTTELEPAAEGVTTELTLAAGAASGNGGVNTFSGSYETPGDGEIAFSPIASTMMAGEPAASEQEAEFFAALDAAESFEINDGKLVFGDNGNNTLMVLVAK